MTQDDAGHGAQGAGGTGTPEGRRADEDARADEVPGDTHATTPLPVGQQHDTLALPQDQHPTPAYPAPPYGQGGPGGPTQGGWPSGAQAPSGGGQGWAYPAPAGYGPGGPGPVPAGAVPRPGPGGPWYPYGPSQQQRLGAPQGPGQPPQGPGQGGSGGFPGQPGPAGAPGPVPPGTGPGGPVPAGTGPSGPQGPTGPGEPAFAATQVLPGGVSPAESEAARRDAAGVRWRMGRQILFVTVLTVLAGAAGYAGGVVADQQGPGLSVVTHSPAPGPRAPESVAGVAAAVLPSVVSIETRSSSSQGTGSGFVLSEEGYVLTNHHVIADVLRRGEIVVLYSDGTQETAEVVGSTSAYDLAVLKVGRRDLPALPLADSSDLLVGDPVIAVGAPLGLDSTVTTGIVSALNRPVEAGDGQDSAFINAIQTDAAINPGNSGGPLVNMQGQVVGINSAIARTPGAFGTGGNIGLGFAIPGEQAARTAQQIIDVGYATYPVAGILLDRSYTGQGVRVMPQGQGGTPAVTPGGAADAAGIRPGDVIVEFEGRPMTDPDQLIVAIRAQTPGDTVTLKVRTGREERLVEVTLDESDRDG